MGYLNFSWVLEGSLAGAEGPKNRRDLMFLKLQDITAVIRMEEQTISGESMEMADLYEPVPDFNPPKLEQIERMVKWIDEQIETWEHPVVVTCQAGLGRRGTILACYLEYVGYQPENAVKLVRELRPGSIESKVQEEAVTGFSEHRKAEELERRRKAIEALGGR